MMTRIMVTLEGNEPAALATMARKDLRDPREQLRFLLRREAQAQGLLSSESSIGKNGKAASGDTDMSTGNDQTKDPQQV
jgi:hypothetical protein